MVSVTTTFCFKDDFLKNEYENYVAEGGNFTYKTFVEMWICNSNEKDFYQYDDEPSFEYDTEDIEGIK